MRRAIAALMFVACSSSASPTTDAGAPCVQRQYFTLGDQRLYVTVPCNPFKDSKP